MEHVGFWSILPPLCAILLAVKTKQVYGSLLFGIWLGWLVLSGGNPIAASFQSIEGLVDVFKDAGNTRTVMFCALMGSLLVFIQRSGGVEGFIRWIQNRLASNPQRSLKKSRRIVQELAFLTGILLFIETSISSLMVGTLFRPLFDKFKISREKLAYIADATSAPICALFPMNAWGAFIMGLLVNQNIQQPLRILINALPYNFYSLVTLFLVLLSILFLNLGPMKKAEKRILETGAVLNPGANPMVSSDITLLETKPGFKPRMINMLLPMAVLVLTMPVMLTITGWNSIDPSELSLIQKTLHALGRGSGSAAVLYSVLIAMALSAILYRIQGVMRFRESVDSALEGIAGLMPLALLMVLAFAIGNVTKSLGTGAYVAGACRSWLSPALVPVVIYTASSVISFATGTSWGTYAIMIPIAIPVAETLGTSIPIVVAATLGGGVFGDHCSPISDTTLISSMAAATDHIDHVRTQIPYALIGGTFTALFYLMVGLIANIA